MLYRTAKGADGDSLPAHDILTVPIRRVRSKVTNDVVVSVRRDSIRNDTLPRASEDLDGGRTNAPVELKGADPEIDGIGWSGCVVGVQSMATCCLANDVLVRLIDERYEGPFTLQLQAAKLSKCSECGIVGPPTSRQSTRDACADRLDASAAEIPD
jgi:hypothetical protein